MNAEELLRQSLLREAIESLDRDLLERPGDARRRTFLFELLCFAGEYSRAEECLAALARSGAAAAEGALLYRSALHADRERHAYYEALPRGEFIPLIPAARPGTLNGERFKTIQDIDPRVGPNLEVFAAGDYIRISFYELEGLKIEAPQQLRDLIWPVARIATGPDWSGRDMAEGVLPVLHPFSWRHASDRVKLGRETDWVLEGEDDVLQTPFGQKMLVLDGERAVPFLEIRTLIFDAKKTRTAPPRFAP